MKKGVDLQILMRMMLFSDDNFIRRIKMQVEGILSKHVSKVMHKTRLTTLSMLVGSLFHAKFFSLTGLGRAHNHCNKQK